MTIVLVGVGVLTAAVAAGVVALAWVEPSWRPFVIAVSLLVVGATVAKYWSPSGLMLAAAGAREPAGDRERRMGETVVRLAALADLPAPSFAVVESQWANAFSTGIRRRGSVVVTTTALLELLDEAELEAVLAHELAHVANRDAGVMTIAAVPRTLGETMIAESGPVYWLWFPIWWLGIPVWALGSMLTLALSRYREFAADRGSACSPAARRT